MYTSDGILLHSGLYIKYDILHSCDSGGIWRYYDDFQISYVSYFGFFVLILGINKYIT